MKTRHSLLNSHYPLLTALLFLSFSFLVFSLSYASNQRADSLLLLLSKDGNDSIKVRHINSLALTYCALGKTDSAVEMETKAIILAQQINDSKGLGTAYNNVATAYFIKRDYKSTLANFQKAMKAYEKLGDKGKGEVEGIIASIGFIYEAQGDYSTAMEYYNRSLTMAKTLGDKKKIAMAIGNIGNIYHMQGEDAKAMDCYLKALELKEQTDDKPGVVKSASNVASQYKDRGDYPKALEYYTKALNAAKEINNSDLLANTYINIGEVYHQEGDMQNALENEQKALVLAQALQFKPLLASVNSSIGLIFWGKGDYSKALTYYDTALYMAQKSGDKSVQATLLGDIGIVCETQGDYPRALDYELKSLALCDELGDKSGVTVCNGNIGEIYLKQEKYKDAEKYILQALYLADTIHLLEAIQESNLQLSNLFAKTGQWQKAFDAYKEYAKAKDSLFKQSKKHQLYKLEAKADFDEAIAMQKATEDEADALEALRSRTHKIIFGLIGAILLISAIVGLVLVRLKHKLDRQKEQLEKTDGQNSSTHTQL